MEGRGGSHIIVVSPLVVVHSYFPTTFGYEYILYRGKCAYRRRSQVYTKANLYIVESIYNTMRDRKEVIEVSRKTVELFRNSDLTRAEIIEIVEAVKLDLLINSGRVIIDENPLHMKENLKIGEILDNALKKTSYDKYHQTQKILNCQIL